MNAQIVRFIELGLEGVDATTISKAILDIRAALSDAADQRTKG